MKLPAIIIGAAGLLWWGLAISPPPKDLKISNLTARSLTLTWDTARAARGCVVGYGCDAHRQKLTAHWVDLSGLEPDTQYRFWVRSGFSFKSISAKTGQLAKTAPPLPNPAYGQAVLSDQLTPAAYANVFITAADGLLSTYANETGNWSINLPELGDAKALLLEIDAGVKGSAKRVIYLGEHQPTSITRLGP